MRSFSQNNGLGKTYFDYHIHYGPLHYVSYQSLIWKLFAIAWIWYQIGKYQRLPCYYLNSIRLTLIVVFTLGWLKLKCVCTVSGEKKRYPCLLTKTSKQIESDHWKPSFANYNDSQNGLSGNTLVQIGTYKYFQNPTYLTYLFKNKFKRRFIHHGIIRNFSSNVHTFIHQYLYMYVHELYNHMSHFV